MLVFDHTKFRIAREAAGLTQMELAGHTGYSQKNLSHIEVGRNRNPSIKLIALVAKHTGVPINFFFVHKDAPEDNGN